MSIFGDIVGKIFGTHVAGTAQAGMSGSSPSNPTPASTSPAAVAIPPGAASAPAPSVAKPSPASSVDVAAVLDALDEDSDEDLDWRKSIVDLMKLLKLDSGLGARRELAKELGYTGDTKIRPA